MDKNKSVVWFFIQVVNPMTVLGVGSSDTHPHTYKHL